MTFTKFHLNMFYRVLNFLIRFFAKILLRLDWNLANSDDVRLQLLKSPMFPRIDAEVRLFSLRDMVSKMRFYSLTFKELGINPLEFWETLKRFAREIRDEIMEDFYGNYFGRHLAKRCISILGDALKFVHEESTLSTSSIG